MAINRLCILHNVRVVTNCCQVVYAPLIFGEGLEVIGNRMVSGERVAYGSENFFTYFPCLLVKFFCLCFLHFFFLMWCNSLFYLCVLSTGNLWYELVTGVVS